MRTKSREDPVERQKRLQRIRREIAAEVFQDLLEQGTIMAWGTELLHPQTIPELLRQLADQLEKKRQQAARN